MMAAAGEEADVAAVVDAYVDCFNRQDFESAARHYALPFSWLRGRRKISVATAAELIAMLRTTAAQLRAGGLSRTILRHQHIHVFGDAALIGVLAVRYCGDGAERMRLGGTYLMHRQDDGWKLALHVAHDPATFLRPFRVGGDAGVTAQPEEDDEQRRSGGNSGVGGSL